MVSQKAFSQMSYGTVKPQLIPGEAIVPQKVCNYSSQGLSQVHDNKT